MAAISVTANSVLGSGAAGTNFAISLGQLGEAGTAGQIVYKKAADSKFWLSQADGSAEESGSGVQQGALLGGGVAGQYVGIITSGTIVCGGTVVKGTFYYVHTTAGAFGVYSELSSTNYVTQIGQAISTTVINLSFSATGTVI